MQNPERFSDGVFIYGAVGMAEEMLVSVSRAPVFTSPQNHLHTRRNPLSETHSGFPLRETEEVRR